MEICSGDCFSQTINGEEAPMQVLSAVGGGWLCIRTDRQISETAIIISEEELQDILSSVETARSVVKRD